jgi:hypothetical protein
MISTANFFWHGNITLYEYACISSFVKNNFKVQVFAFDDNLKIPAGATLRFAGDIMPKEQLYSYTLSGQKGSMAGFADAFRLHLLKKKEGWWFDADVLCLKDVSVFVENVRSKPKLLSMGYQNSKYINNAVIYADDDSFVESMLNRLKSLGNTVQWGEIGPRLITEIINRFGYMDYVDPVEKYYPIDNVDLIKLFDPEFNSWSHTKVNNAYAVHLWNDVLRRFCIPKNVLPPDGSYLYEIIIAYCPELRECLSLPFDTLKRLFDYEVIKLERDRIKKKPIEHFTAIAQQMKCNVRKIVSYKKNEK